MYIKQQYDSLNTNKKTVPLEGNETIVENVNRVIEHIKNNPIHATKNRFLFAIKNIKELNEIVVNPIELITTRPVQMEFIEYSLNKRLH